MACTKLKKCTFNLTLILLVATVVCIISGGIFMLLSKSHTERQPRAHILSQYEQHQNNNHQGTSAYYIIGIGLMVVGCVFAIVEVCLIVTTAIRNRGGSVHLNDHFGNEEEESLAYGVKPDKIEDLEEPTEESRITDKGVDEVDPEADAVDQSFGVDENFSGNNSNLNDNSKSNNDSNTNNDSFQNDSNQRSVRNNSIIEEPLPNDDLIVETPVIKLVPQRRQNIAFVNLSRLSKSDDNWSSDTSNLRFHYRLPLINNKESTPINGKFGVNGNSYRSDLIDQNPLKNGRKSSKNSLSIKSQTSKDSVSLLESDL